MQIFTQTLTHKPVRPFRAADLITPKDSGTKGKTIVMLTRRGVEANCFEYVSFSTQTGLPAWSGTAHKFTSDEWELFEGQLVLSN